MRIVLVNWAPIVEGAAVGGGVSGYAQGLALELASRGHEVSYISSGNRYVPADVYGAPGPCEARRMADFRGVRVFEIINSPVLAPAIAQFADPAGEVSAPALEAEFARLLALLRPEVIHFQNIEGMSAGCIDAAARHGRVVFSLHNYHTVCPQVYLMQGDREPCFDFENGHACARCVRAPDSAAERDKRGHSHLIASGAARLPDGRATVFPLLRGLRQELRERFGQRRDVAMPGRAVRSASDLAPGPTPEAAVDAPDHTPLSNDVHPEPRSALPPNEFAKRRAAMVGALSRCHRVLAVSEFVRRKFEAMGVAPAVLRTMTIGTRMTQIAGAQRLATPPPLDPPRPIRLVFMGYNNYFKGLPMLVDSLDLLAPADLATCHLTVAAKDVQPMERELRQIEPRLAGLAVERGYEYDEVPRIAGGKDLGLVPSVWWDNAPQTVLEFFACGVPVLAAALGGIPEMIRDGVDGLLHRGNDRAHLAGTLARICARPAILGELRAGVRPPKSMTEHAMELEREYAE